MITYSLGTRTKFRSSEGSIHCRLYESVSPPAVLTIKRLSRVLERTRQLKLSSHQPLDGLATMSSIA